MPDHQRTGGGRRPALGVSWEGRPAPLLPAVVPHVDVLEVVPDTLVAADGALNPVLLQQLDTLAADVPVTYHGIGLSIGSVEGWNEDYLRLLDDLVAWRAPRWHSEHLGFTHVGGSFLGTMPALPTTQQSLELVAERATAMRAAYGLEFMLEHVATPLARPGGMPLAAFLNAVAAETGSRILLDLHNLECDVDNGLLDLDEFVAGLDWSLVGEIHVAGGVWQRGYHLDVHAGPVAASTLDLLRLALERAVHLDLVVYEVLGSAVANLGVAAVGDQLRTVRGLLDAAAATAPPVSVPVPG